MHHMEHYTMKEIWKLRNIADGRKWNFENEPVLCSMG